MQAFTIKNCDASMASIRVQSSEDIREEDFVKIITLIHDSLDRNYAVMALDQDDQLAFTFTITPERHRDLWSAEFGMLYTLAARSVKSLIPYLNARQALFDAHPDLRDAALNAIAEHYVKVTIRSAVQGTKYAAEYCDEWARHTDGVLNLADALVIEHLIDDCGYKYMSEIFEGCKVEAVVWSGYAMRSDMPTWVSVGINMLGTPDQTKGCIMRIENSLHIGNHVGRVDIATPGDWVVHSTKGGGLYVLSNETFTTFFDPDKS